MFAEKFIHFYILALVFMSAPRLTSAQSARQLAQDTFPSVVLLVMQDANGQAISLGSGFFVSQGIIVTNLHVVRGASSGQAKIVGQTRTYPVNGLVGINANADIVLLDIRGASRAPPLVLSESSDLAVGDVVYAVGNPEGLEGTFSQGIVSGFRGNGPDKLLQITAPISPGSSGGPVINNRGEVVGVAVATFKEGQNLNFAVPVSSVAPLLKDIRKPRALSSEPEVQGDAKTAPLFGSETTTQGVIGTDFRWLSGYENNISFAILNQTASPVKDVHFLVVFFGRDKKHGFHPIDYVEGVTCPNEIVLPNLPKRQDRFSTDCYSLRPHDGVYARTRKVEIRVLDFKLAQ
jgi:S1-C subfamily serine protease